MLIPVTRVEGVTTTLAAPEGHLISGQAVLVDLDGGTIEQMLVKSPVGMVARLNEDGKDEAGGSRAGLAQRLRRGFNDALEDGRRQAGYGRAPSPPRLASAADLGAPFAVLRGQP